MTGGVVPFVPVQIATQPGGRRTEPGKEKKGKPEVVAVLVQKRSLGATDDRRSSSMHGGFCFLLGLGLGDVPGASDPLPDRVANGEKLPIEGRRLGF